MDYSKQSPVILSLCPGMRGLERGFERSCEQLGWKPGITAAYVEIEAFIAYNLVKQMEQGLLDAAPIHTNIKTFDGKLFCGKIDGIFGGYPCQPFSLAGDRKGSEDPRHLWPYIYGIIESIRPVFCFFENVSGHITMGFDEVYRGLRDLGYTVEAGIFTAEEVGAPHKRERLFILAIRNNLVNTGEFRFYNEQKGFKEIEIDKIGEFQTIKSPRDNKQCWVIKPSINSELANANNYGQDGTENCQSPFEGSNYYASGQKYVFEFTRRSYKSKHEELEYSHINTLQRREIVGRLRNEFGRTSDKLGNSQGINKSGYRFEKGISQEQIGGHGNGEMANSDKLKLEGRGNTRKQEFRTKTTKGLYNRSSTSSLFPSKPGRKQYEWEEPRVESRLGFTINGYNFREDLLRMAGNGVVEQTAEIAFLNLLEKFRK